jgi:hypothetical protein
MATKANLVIDQGSDYTVTIYLTSANGAVLDTTGYTGRAQMRKSHSSSVYKEFTVVVSGGTAVLSMTNSYTASITAGRYLYDVETVAASGNVKRVQQGTATITPEITR